MVHPDSRPQRRAGISGVILAGGLARRMGGVDKGLQCYGGKALVAHVIERFATQADELFINANGNSQLYVRFGYPLIADRMSGYPGPLAGIHAALTVAHYDLLAAVPCDAPHLPPDLVARLARAIGGHAVAVARSPAGPQPVFCLCRREALASLEAFLRGGGHRMQDWCKSVGAIDVPFEQDDDFANINTLAELAAAPESKL